MVNVVLHFFYLFFFIYDNNFFLIHDHSFDQLGETHWFDSELRGDISTAYQCLGATTKKFSIRKSVPNDTSEAYGYLRLCITHSQLFSKFCGFYFNQFLTKSFKEKKEGLFIFQKLRIGSFPNQSEFLDFQR